MKELIDKLSKTCENCKYRGTLSNNYPCCDCLVPEQDNGNPTGYVTFTKFSPIEATGIPKHNDLIHRYLNKLKEEGLITNYEIRTMFTVSGDNDLYAKPYSKSITLIHGKYKYTHMFNDLNDQNLVIEIISECMLKLYRMMAKDLMEEIKEE